MPGRSTARFVRRFLLFHALLYGGRFVLPSEELSGELVLRSYQYTYPGKVQEVGRIDGDWAIRVGGKTFYWAGGRLLPEELRDSPESYRPHGFSIYPQSIPSPEDYSPEEIAELRRLGSNEARGNREDPHRAFQAALYGGLSREEIERKLIRRSFLGHPVTVHRDIADALDRIERAIFGLAETDGDIPPFLASIRSVEGYNWREIRGTRRMSYHSWGLAVDIQCEQWNNRGRGGKAVYWLWEQARNENWMLIPLEERWMPPDGIIRAFENEGFTWGGKWRLYDNMHFEYRPELHEINRLLAGGAGETRIIRAEDMPDLHHIYPRF
jgi:hypothetical protein